MKIKSIDKEFLKIIISLIIFIVSLSINKNPILKTILIITSYIIISFEIYINSFKKIKEGELFDENTLMIIASICAILIGEYQEGVSLIILFSIGEYLSDKAVDKSKDKVRELMDLKVEKINVIEKDKLIEKRIEDVKKGEIFQVKPGEKIGLDGIIEEVEAYIDTSSLTGESIPQKVKKKDVVLSGSICTDKVITVKSTSIFETSTANKILKTIENSNEKKASSEKFITKFSKIYTPVIISLAIMIGIIKMALTKNINNSIYTALVFLVSSCPCALVLSVPLSFFCGIGRASKEGILIKGANSLENIKRIESIMLDKTGTLTKGNFEVIKINCKDNEVDEQLLLTIAAHLEYYSIHPIATSILRKYNKKIRKERIREFKEIKGKGIEAKYNNKKYYIGNYSLLKEKNINLTKEEEMGTIIYIGTEEKYLGNLIIADEIKENSKKSIQMLNNLGIKKISILSGDNEQIVKSVAKELKIEQYYAALLPHDKVSLLKKEKEKYFTAFVGDGINDGPVLKMADISFSMGGIGSDTAIEASDIVLMHDDLEDVAKAIKISKFTNWIVRYNIFLTLVTKALVLILGIFDLTSIQLAIFADVGITLICVLNAIIILNRKI